ncbi:MAG: hypothetical protein HUU20_25240 [Pirellulales bacterium]|nr:hypothetical protein [Pirellulales bacterium]
MELLAGQHAGAADLADAFLRSLTAGTHARFDDDRLFAHRLGNLFEAWLDWSPVRPPAELPSQVEYLPHAQLLVRRTARCHTVISAARGGVFKHHGTATPPVTDAGLVLETTDHRIAVSQCHDRGRPVELLPGDSQAPAGLSVAGDLCWSRFETATPLKQAIFHLGMCTLGRWCRTLVRRVLQKRLITGRSRAPVRFTRRFEFLPERGPLGAPTLRVTDTIELTSPSIRVARMAYGTDFEAAYVAAAGGYEESVLQPWTDLGQHVEQLNTRRRVTVVREL